jgi:Arylsulfotransferase (ASST)
MPDEDGSLRMARSAWGSRARAAAIAAVAVAGALAGAVPASAASSLKPPPVTVLTDQGGERGGDLFVSPFGDSSTYANGAEILSPDGKKVVWFHPVPAGQEASDFRAQRYRGQPVLTWWQGTGLGGVASGADYIYNSHYQQIAVVKAGNGYSADGHEFLITPWGTALILAYTTATANLTSIGGPADQTVIDGIVQEVDIRTGKVLLHWNSADHVPYAQSEQPLPDSASTPWDWFHVNAVKLDGHGGLLIDARDTWTTYDVSRRTGRINWQLGGKASSFSEQAAPGQVLNNAGRIFAWQHDPEPLGNGRYTFFDNESAGTANIGSGALTNLPHSRIDTVQLNFRTRTATLVKTVNQPENLSAPSQGDGQTLPSGDLVVGWGSLPYVSEFSRSGSLLFNLQFPTGVNTYRAYRFPWKS